ncbi:MAG: transglycosylase domain-containing protein, partial [Pseudomonadota bacterium]
MRLDRWCLALALLLLSFGIARDATDRWIAATDLPVLLTDTSVEVLDRNGQLLRLYTVDDGRWRLATSLDAVDPGYVDMLIAYEDKRFYRHNGLDPRAMMRALGQAVWHGEVVSGGSTLTMQVARLLEDSGTGRLRGKLRQIRVALALERALSKDDILTLYLARAPFGGNLEGVRAASLAWFGKEPRRLTPAQSALLVALPQAPEARRPDKGRRAAELARDRVLERMVTNGTLTQDTARAALTEPVPVNRRAFPALAPHLTDRAKTEDPTRLTHHLTVDASLQARMETLAQTALRGLPDDLSV